VLAHARTKEIDENGAFISHYVTPHRTDYDDPVKRFCEVLETGGNQCYQIFGVMRMSALRQIPPQGSHMNADGVLLTRMSLLGRFCEVPEYLFLSRRHAHQSAAILPIRLRQPRRFRLTNWYCSCLPCPEWWDPAKTRALVFPEFRLLLEHFLSIFRASLSTREKLRCYSMLLHWTRCHRRKMVKDLVAAADQVLYNLQVSRTAEAE
jgi:hypothetical protein